MSRSTRIWLAVAGLVAVIGVAATFLAFRLYPKGSLGQRFESRDPVTVELAAGKPRMIWVKESDNGFATLTCDVSGPGATHMERVLPEYGVDELTDEDGVRWRGQAVVDATPAGTYTVTCPTDNREGASLSIGDPPRFRTIPVRYVAPVLPFLPALLGGVVALGLAAIALRRHQRRT